MPAERLRAADRDPINRLPNLETAGRSHRAARGVGSTLYSETRWNARVAPKTHFGTCASGTRASGPRSRTTSRGLSRYRMSVEFPICECGGIEEIGVVGPQCDRPFQRSRGLGIRFHGDQNAAVVVPRFRVRVIDAQGALVIAACFPRAAGALQHQRRSNVRNKIFRLGCVPRIARARVHESSVVVPACKSMCIGNSKKCATSNLHFLASSQCFGRRTYEPLTCSLGLSARPPASETATHVCLLESQMLRITSCSPSPR
jgi:hypothetical protein